MYLFFVFKRTSFITAIKFLLVKIVNKLLGGIQRFHYSQTGEDIIISTLLDQKKEGFYVEVGCNHPYHFSNTFSLYMKGWNGICIDANQKLLENFKKVRPLDNVIYAAVSDEEIIVPLYLSEESLVSTIHNSFRESWLEEWSDKSHIIEVKTKTLDNILMENNINNQIDLLCIDVEGHDFEVLKSINLLHYQPKLIVIEMHEFNLESVDSSEIYLYLKEHNYRLLNYATMNGFFVRN